VRTRPLGFHHHRLGPAVAEALLHDPCAHRALAGLQRHRGSSAGSAVFVFVAHALACTSAGRYPAKKPFFPCEKGAWTYLPRQARFPTLRSRTRPGWPRHTSKILELFDRTDGSPVGLKSPSLPHVRSPTTREAEAGGSLIDARHPMSSDRSRARQGERCVSHSPRPRPNPIHLN